MSRIPEEAMYMGNLAQDLDNVFDEYEQELVFYVEELRGRSCEGMAEEFGYSGQEASSYKIRALENLEETAEQLQSIVREVYPLVRDFEPQDFTGGPLENFPTLEYDGPEEAVEQIESTLDRLRRYREQDEVRIPRGAQIRVEDHTQGTLRQRFGEEEDSSENSEFPEDCTIRDLLADEDETLDISLKDESEVEDRDTEPDESLIDYVDDIEDEDNDKNS